MQFWAVFKPDGLHPLYSSDDETMKKLKYDTEYLFKVTKPRNIAFHRKNFALINMVYENQEQFNNIDDLRAYLTIKAGFYNRIPTGKGDMILPKSISFAAMDDTEFSEYYSKMIDAVIAFLDISKKDVLQNISDFM